MDDILYSGMRGMRNELDELKRENELLKRRLTALEQLIHGDNANNWDDVIPRPFGY